MSKSLNGHYKKVALEINMRHSKMRNDSGNIKKTKYLYGIRMNILHVNTRYAIHYTV